MPARLFQKALLKSTGSLNTGARRLSVSWSGMLLRELDRPAGAGWPLLVRAVAVVAVSLGEILTKTSGN